MGASAWTIYASARKKIGEGAIVLSTDAFRLALYGDAATSDITGDRSVQSSISDEVTQAGGYLTGGTPLSAPTWTRSAETITFDASDWEVSGSIANIRFALVVFSVGPTSGHTLCYAALSNAQFDVSAADTLILRFASTGIFILV